jgi:hypothetical protein
MCIKISFRAGAKQNQHRVEKNRPSNKLSNENKISTGWKKTVLRTNYLMKTNQLILAPFRVGANKIRRI